MRLDKFLSQQLGISRSLVLKELRAKKVSIGGKIIRDGATKILPGIAIYYSGLILNYLPGFCYFMLNKPKNRVCAAYDLQHASVLDLIEERTHHQLHIAGRLDIDTTGLVLITNDGQWSHRVCSPKYTCQKIYYVRLASKISVDAIEIFAKGLQLHREKQFTRPAILEIIDDLNVRFTITEGKYHQVKRMFAAIGNHVVSLHREQIGSIVLDPLLSQGEYRILNQEEINSF